ncbi:hypothetical protein AKJ16_DCAP23995 [Drosera capensis]
MSPSSLVPDFPLSKLLRAPIWPSSKPFPVRLPKQRASVSKSLVEPDLTVPSWFQASRTPSSISASPAPEPALEMNKSVAAREVRQKKRLDTTSRVHEPALELDKLPATGEARQKKKSDTVTTDRVPGPVLELDKLAATERSGKRSSRTQRTLAGPRKRPNIVVTTRGPNVDSGAGELRSPSVAQAPFGTVISQSTSTPPVGPVQTVVIPPPSVKLGAATFSESLHGGGLDKANYLGFSFYRSTWFVNPVIS